jgi:hypothetical protein
MKYHFYLFSFSDLFTTVERTAAVALGLTQQRVTNVNLQLARQRAGVSQNAAALAVSYLGHMTEEEFASAE